MTTPTRGRATVPIEYSNRKQRRAGHSERCSRGDHEQCSGLIRANHGLKIRCLCKCGHPHVKGLKMKIKATVLKVRCATCNESLSTLERSASENFIYRHRHHPGFSYLLQVEEPNFLAGSDIPATVKTAS